MLPLNYSGNPMHSPLAFALLLVVNVVISFLNARAIGPVWRHRGEMGWGLWLVVWSAAVQSAIGFSLPVMLLELLGAYAAHWLPVGGAKLAFSVWYVMVVVPLVGTGITLTANALVAAWKRPSARNVAASAWNVAVTADDFHHLAPAVQHASSAIGDFDFSGGDDGEGVLAIVVVVGIVVIGLFSGALITNWLIDAYSVPEFRRG
jgi:hypothetical protein